MENGGESEVAHMSPEWARKMFYASAPFWYNLRKRFVVDETYIETLATVFDNISDC